MIAVFRREMLSYFSTPVGYIFLMMYTGLAGVVYVFINIGREMSASMNLLYSGMQLPFLLLAPLLTMRLFAEEKRMRTDQLLFTVPVPVSRVVAGKLGAACVMLALSMGLTLFYPLLISRWAQVSPAQIFSVWLGYYLLGVSLLALGTFISALCVNQVSAAVFTLGVNVFLYLNEHYILPQQASAALRPVQTVLSWLPSAARLGDFSNGVISLADTVYFLAAAGLMMFLTCRVLERGRFVKR